MDDHRKNYRAWDAQQNCHDSISPRDALPDDDLVFFLLDLIPQIDLTPFHQYYAQEMRGQPPFDVTMMVTLLVYAYSVGIRSSRKIAAPASAIWLSAPLSATIGLTSARLAIFARFIWRRSGPYSLRCCAWLARWGWSNLGTCPRTGQRWERMRRGTRP